MNTRKLCRACLSTKDSFNYFLFDNVSPEIYWFCTTIEANEQDDLPRALCNSCYEHLTKYSEFKKTCIESQNTLLRLHNGLKLEADRQTSVDHNEEHFDEIEDFIKTEEAEKFIDYHDEPTIEFTDNNVKKEKSQKRLRKRVKLKKIKNLGRPEYNSYVCDICNKKFKYPKSFEAHKLEHQGKRLTLQCEPCQKTFQTWSGLKRHKDSTHKLVNLESLQCRTCGRIYKSMQTLKAHEQTHRHNERYVCELCGKQCSTSVILKAHLEIHKDYRERAHTCEHCGKKFFTRSILLSHVSRLHTGKRFICDICTYPFTNKFNLMKHIMNHEGKKLYQCDICQKSYSGYSSLVEHKRLHSGDRPFNCMYCPKNFASKRRMMEHVRIHTGDKPHKCGVCEQRFTQRGTLQRHMKVHNRAVTTLM